MTAKQISYIRGLQSQIATLKNISPAPRMSDDDAATLNVKEASALIDMLKQVKADAQPKRETAMDAHVRRMDAFRAERKAAASTITVLIVDHLGNQYDQVEVSTADWSPEANTGIHPVPGHSCPDGCCGLQADTATLEIHPDGTTVEGCIC